MQLEIMSMKFRLPYCLIFLLIVILSGCSFTQQSVHTAIAPTAVDSFLSTPTLEKNMGTTSSEAFATPNLRAPETKTPMSTLSPAERAEFIKELLVSNGECKLPCFWGVFPGTTDWNDARNFLRTFGEVREGDHYSVTIRDPDDVRDSLIEFRVEEGIVTEINAGSSVTGNFTIDKVLNEYGKPERIYLLTFKNSPSSITPAFSVLDYQNQGVLVEYEFVSNKINDTEFSICTEPTGPNLWLRSPGQMITDQDINHLVLGAEPAYSLRKIDNVTDITIEEFHNEFKGSPACFITQINIWP
jgi:hypothetical protein